jgi:hypothetical protein
MRKLALMLVSTLLLLADFGHAFYFSGSSPQAFAEGDEYG